MDKKSSSSSATTPAPVPDTASSASTTANTHIAPTPLDPSPASATPSSQSTTVSNEVVRKIIEAQNVLVALSGDPSVDEMAAAIGLSLFLDKLGKRATAIYSGSTPNALEFLKPEETFETTADALQDFVIAKRVQKY